MSAPNLDVLPISASGPSGTLVVGPDDGPTLIINLDQNNTVFLHNGVSFTTVDQSGIFPLAPNQSLVIDPSTSEGLSVYAITVSGQTANLGVVPGGTHFFQPTSKLTIPTGATTGERIEIDGTNGTITMFDNSNNITGQWSATSQSIYVGNPAQNYAKLAQKAGLSGLYLNPNPATLTEGGIFTTYSSLSGKSTLQIDAPDSAGGTQGSIFLQSGDASNPPVLFTSSGTSVDSNMFTYNAGNDYNPAAGNVTLGAAPSGDVFVASATFTVEANRSYKITAAWDGITTGGTQTNNHYIVRLKRGNSGGTIIMSQRYSATNINQSDNGGIIIAPPDTPFTGPGATGTATYTLTINHDVGTDSSVVITPAFVMAEGWQ